MKTILDHLTLAIMACGLAAAGEPSNGLTREEALKFCRMLGGVECGKYWFDEGDEEGPYHHAGRLILSHGGGASYAVAEADGATKLHLASRLGVHTIATRALWHGALLRATHSGVAVYDTLFVELADRERVPLATFDRRLLKAWPAIARRPADLPAARA